MSAKLRSGDINIVMMLITSCGIFTCNILIQNNKLMTNYRYDANYIFIQGFNKTLYLICLFNLYCYIHHAFLIKNICVICT